MKYLIIIATLLLSACTPSGHEVVMPVIPDGLKDCKFFKLTDENGTVIRVVRCPMSSTSATYQSGKVSTTTVVIDGMEYVKK